MTTFHGFGDFANRAPKMLQRGIKTAGVSLVRRTASGVMDRMQDMNPPRSKRDHKHFADSWFFARNGIRMGVTLPEIRPGDTVSAVNDAPHALILDLGLSTTKTGPAVGRRIGTRAAPRGYSKPALLYARSRRNRWIAQALIEGARHL